jgi:hypothetical protein
MDPIFGLAPLEPDLWRGLGQLVLQVAQEAAVSLPDLKAVHNSLLCYTTNFGQLIREARNMEREKPNIHMYCRY